MVSLYEILTDKYGEYYISYGKKNRIKTLKKHNNKIDNIIEEMEQNIYYTEMEINEYYMKNIIRYRFIYLGTKKYIEFY